MNTETQNLIVPIVIKDRADMPWPEDSFFYILSNNGLFLARNHPFFTSVVPAREFPTELARQEPFLIPDFPPIPGPLIERIVGFFTRIGREHGAESAVLLIWDMNEKRLDVLVPEQTATISRSSSGRGHPIGLRYETPTDLPPHMIVVGDVHCHVDLAAFSSGIDVHDEVHLSGLHIVVGRISEEPPEFHAEAVVDGQRFKIDTDTVVGEYEQRDLDVPAEWIAMVKIDDGARTPRYAWGQSWSSGSSNGTPAYGTRPNLPAPMLPASPKPRSSSEESARAGEQASGTSERAPGDGAPPP